MDYIGSGPWVSIYATALLCAALIAAHQFGRVVLNFLSLPVISKNETILFAVGLGLTALTLGIFLLGIAGFLTRPAIGLLFTTFIFTPLILHWRSKGLRSVTGDAEGESSILFKEDHLNKIEYRRRQDPWRYFFILILLVVGVLSFVQALAPCTGMDALAYHLYLPKEFIRLGKIEFLPFTRESLWPLNTEMLFMAGLLFQGTALAQLFHWIFYPLTAAAVYLCAKRYFGLNEALGSVGIFIFTPAVFAQSGYPYVDISLAFFIFMTVYVFLLAVESGRIGCYVLCGIFCGAAIGAKFLGLGCLVVTGLMVLWGSRFNLKKTLLFTGVTLLVGGGWYLRSWILSGNPVYPLFVDLFNGNGWSIQMDEGAGMGKGLLAFFLFPWNITMFPVPFGGQMVGAFFLMLIPLLIPEFKRSRSISFYLMIFSLGYTAFIFSQSQQARFFISVVPFLSLGAGTALTRIFFKGKILKIVAFIVVSMLFVLHMGIFVYRLKDIWPVVTGKVSANDWLISHERSFKGFEYLREHTRPSDKILNAAEVRYFYAPGDNITHLPQASVRLQREKISLRSYLELENFEYIWLADSTDPKVLEYVRQNNYTQVYNYSFTEKPDIFQNFIYKKPPDH